VVFVAPAESGWILPLYELALMTVHEFPEGPDVTVVTTEPRPLDVFGPIASDALARLLHGAGVEFVGRTRAVECVGDALATADGACCPPTP
jgi:sulfide:quinone oxidoreductase